MSAFLARHDGAVRFDRYMAEHLFHPNLGYYEHVRIGLFGDFVTGTDRRVYAELVRRHLQSTGAPADQLVEVGGGNGDFRRHYRSLAPQTQYLSVERSSRLARQQSFRSGLLRAIDRLLPPTSPRTLLPRESGVVRGEAWALPFADRSIRGAVFSNELIDALPTRVLRVRNSGDGARVTDELFIEQGERGGAVPAYLTVKRGHDPFIEAYERYLRQQDGSLSRELTRAVSPYTPLVLNEMARVLEAGRVVLMDYGHWRANPLERAEPYFAWRGHVHGVERIVAHPYLTDITTMVDFDWLRWLANQAGETSLQTRPARFSELEPNWPIRYPRGKIETSLFTCGQDYAVLDVKVDPQRAAAAAPRLLEAAGLNPASGRVAGEAGVVAGVAR